MKPAFNIINISPKYSAIWKYGYNVHRVLSKDSYVSNLFEVKFIDLWGEKKVSHNNVLRALQLLKGVKLDTTEEDINLYTLPLLSKTMLKNKSKQNIMVIHDLFPLYDKTDIKTKALCKTLYEKSKLADVIITDSKYTTKEYEDYYYKEKSDNTKKPQHIYLGIDDVYFDDTKVSKSSKLTFVSIGRDEPRKNLEFLIKLLHKLDQKGIDFELIRIGNFSDEHLHLINKLSLNKKIFLKRDVSEAALAEIYSKSHFLLFPSLTEGFGLPPLEAMSRGCIPLVYKEGGSLPEVVIIKELCLDLDLDAWADKIQEIYANPSKMEKLSQECIEHAQNYKWENYATELKRLLWQM